MIANRNIEFILIGGGTSVSKVVGRRKPSNIKHLSSLNEIKNNSTDSVLHFLIKGFIEKLIKLSELLNDRYIFDATKLRFAAAAGIPHFKIMENKSAEEQNRFRLFFDYRRGLSLAHPWPRSRLIFRVLKFFRDKVLYFFVRHDDVTGIQNLKLDLVLFGRYDMPLNIFYWRRVFKRANVKVATIVGSWDHPTTKGPPPSDIDHFIVASNQMRKEMIALHDIDNKKITQIGKVQMDRFTDHHFSINRDDFLSELGFPEIERFILFATNTTGLKEHEVSIVHEVTKWIKEGRFGKNVSLVIRCHPQDINAQQDFKVLDDGVKIRCLVASAFGCQGDDPNEALQDQRFLASLLKHSEMVIQSRGSIALDAAAFDTPIISLNFDGDLIRTDNDSFRRENEYAHYKPIIDSQGTWVVDSYKQLKEAICAYIKDKSIHCKGREKIRREHISFLDGKASQRLVNKLIELADQLKQKSYDFENNHL